MALASQVLGLPACVAFQSKENGKYLRYVHESGEANYKLLHMSGEDAINPFTRFCVEPSREHDGFVHIRCCYNNKYWVARNVDGKWSVHGDADEPVEDPSNPSCTLFKPMITEDSMACSLIHWQLGKEALVSSGTGRSEGDDRCLHVEAAGLGDANADAGAMAMAMFAVSEQEAILPRNVCFRGDNNKYLRGVVRQGYPYLEFSSEDMGAADVRHKTETNSDGRIRLWSVHFGKFWRRSPNWIWADTASDSWSNRDTQFRAVRVDGDDDHDRDNAFFALRNLGNNKFCKRLTTEGKESCLNAAADTITREARMLVRETVLSRKIDEVEYQVKDARIYGHKLLNFSSAQGANTTDSTNTLSLTFKIATTESRTWNSSVTLKLGVKTTISTGIPLVVEGKVEVSAEFSGSYSWGTTIQETKESTVTYQVAVPPRTKVTVTLLATQATYDVPFYYRQRDVLTDGTTQISNLRDGIYTGVNAYDFKYDTKEEKL